MPRKAERMAQSTEPIETLGNTSLRNEVKQALLLILRDPGASAAAKASAGRTILEYYSDNESSESRRRGAEMTAAEIDAAIAELD